MLADDVKFILGEGEKCLKKRYSNNVSLLYPGTYFGVATRFFL